ncbi:delta-aminolevulinic acid dehydratase [Maribellus luteus]|uniref:Delta-aminolevulinic acid dehydratase n=2 Tax=Maribellus luteus TaxID=2305463 RepID=A0A399SWC3_9BACT|nr:delta-aminolevulinic acid dehydratase [Maribellus luteus]
MDAKTLNSFLALKSYIESQNFAGWDPYDGLNSRVFQATPLKHWDLARLAWIQGFKRSPINLRKLLLVPKEYNAKGIGLFLTGYCNLFKAQASSQSTGFGTQQEIRTTIDHLAELLIQLQSKTYSGACWGYNFDWQARRLFLFPKNTPTVVATCFCASALFEAYEITKNETYLETALSAVNFVINDLNRTPKKEGFLFSYSPREGNNTVYNASLLGSKLLSLCYKYSKKEQHKELAKESIIACCNAQEKDGSWVYGELPVQNWIDSFHTGYNLDALQTYQESTGDRSFSENIEKGFEYYIKNFFRKDGTPKYYHNSTYPIDIHCPAQLFVTLNRLHKFDENKQLAHTVMNWTIKNMQDKKGYFYYQLKKGISSKIPYMRWSNAFMFYAMSYYLLNTTSNG